ncbi:MAG: HoxN/HupN/NixA family nickel/cobalt transporter [Casimicrobiaceae bacterium]
MNGIAPGATSRQWLRHARAPLAFVGLLNLLAWLSLWNVAGHDPALLGLGAMAYFLGLRHAFDADHIAAIDNVSRKLRHDGKHPVATGLYFSLGHSTVVIVLSLAVALAARQTETHLPALRSAGGLIGMSVSALFLTIIGLVNLRILLQLLRALQQSREGLAPMPAETIDQLLAQRGFMSRMFRRIQGRIHSSWQMYLIGLLFGLGFDTATEIAILGLSARLAQHGEVSLLAVMTFPLLFTAGMSLMDTLDGVVMLRIYDWAMADALRKLLFNTVVTGLGVMVALVVGGIEWLQLLAGGLGWQGWPWQALEHLDFGTLGILLTVLMVASWGAAAFYYRRALQPLEMRAPD